MYTHSQLYSWACLKKWRIPKPVKIQSFTLWKYNIAMENGPLIDDLWLFTCKQLCFSWLRHPACLETNSTGVYFGSAGITYCPVGAKLVVQEYASGQAGSAPKRFLTNRNWMKLDLKQPNEFCWSSIIIKCWKDPLVIGEKTLLFTYQSGVSSRQWLKMTHLQTTHQTTNPFGKKVMPGRSSTAWLWWSPPRCQGTTPGTVREQNSHPAGSNRRCRSLCKAVLRGPNGISWGDPVR